MEYRQGTYVGYYVNQGIEQGIELGQYQLICSFLDILSDEQIAARTDYSLEDVAKIRAEYDSKLN